MLVEPIIANPLLNGEVIRLDGAPYPPRDRRSLQFAFVGTLCRRRVRASPVTDER